MAEDLLGRQGSCVQRRGYPVQAKPGVRIAFSREKNSGGRADTRRREEKGDAEGMPWGKPPCLSPEVLCRSCPPTAYPARRLATGFAFPTDFVQQLEAIVQRQAKGTSD